MAERYRNAASTARALSGSLPLQLQLRDGAHDGASDTSQGNIVRRQVQVLFHVPKSTAKKVDQPGIGSRGGSELYVLAHNLLLDARRGAGTTSRLYLPTRQVICSQTKQDNGDGRAGSNSTPRCNPADVDRRSIGENPEIRNGGWNSVKRCRSKSLQ
jgi:hypothetical protein